VQDNHSSSERGTLRGLHFQLRHAQAKLCRVVEGEALDVLWIIRVRLAALRKWTLVVLSAEKQNQLYIPAGFAHGFLALSERVQFLYKCSDFYHAEDEHGVLWSDRKIGIPWPIPDPLVSDKDKKLPELAGVPRELLPQYPSDEAQDSAYRKNGQLGRELISSLSRWARSSRSAMRNWI